MIDVQNVRKEFDGFAALAGPPLLYPTARCTAWWVPTARGNPL